MCLCSILLIMPKDVRLDSSNDKFLKYFKELIYRKFSLIYDNWFFWGKIPQLIEKFRISLPPGSPKNLESVTRTFTAPARKVTLHLTPRVPKSWIRGKDSSNKQMDPRQKKPKHQKSVHVSMNTVHNGKIMGELAWSAYRTEILVF